MHVLFDQRRSAHALAYWQSTQIELRMIFYYRRYKKLVLQSQIQSAGTPWRKLLFLIQAKPLSIVNQFLN